MDTKLRIEEILRRKQINLTQLASAMHRSAPNVYISLNNNPQFDFIRSVANSVNKIEIGRTFKDYLEYVKNEKERYIFIKINSCFKSERKKLLEEYFEKKVHFSDFIARESTVYGYLSFGYGEIEYSKTFDDLNGFISALKKCLTSSKKIKTEDIFNSKMSNKTDKNLIVSKIINLLTPDIDEKDNDENANDEDILLAEDIDLNDNNEYNADLYDTETTNELLMQVTKALNDLHTDVYKKAEAERIKRLNENNTENNNGEMSIPVVRLQNLIYSLTSIKSNPTLKRLSDVAKVLNLYTKDLFSDTPKFQLRGIVNLNGEMITVESVRDLYYLKKKSENLNVVKFNDNQIFEQIENVLKVKNEYKIVTNTDKYQKEFSQVIDPSYLDMTEKSNYDGKNQLCYSFRKRGDTRYGIELNFSNMIKLNEKMTCLGKKFWDSECAYIAGYYSLYDDPNIEGIKYKEIQEKISAYTKGGYNAKGIFRKAKNEYTKKLRADFTVNNLNFEWMKIVIFEKAKTNDEFRNALLSIPSNAHIIEDTSYFKIGPKSTAIIWGCQNVKLTKDRIKYRSAIRTKLALMNADKKTIIKAEQMIDNLICDNGIWIGKNATGKAIKLVQIALKKGEIPPINFDLINNNENGFYWFGEKIRIFATADGNDIAYEVIRQ